jgi:hypothetical protein
MARMTNSVRCGLLDGDGVHESEAVVALELYEKHEVLSNREVNSGREGKGRAHRSVGHAVALTPGRKKRRWKSKVNVSEAGVTRTLGFKTEIGNECVRSRWKRMLPHSSPNMTETSTFFLLGKGSLLLIVGCRTLRRRKERGNKRKRERTVLKGKHNFYSPQKRQTHCGRR